MEKIPVTHVVSKIHEFATKFYNEVESMPTTAKIEKMRAQYQYVMIKAGTAKRRWADLGIRTRFIRRYNKSYQHNLTHTAFVLCESPFKNKTDLKRFSSMQNTLIIFIGYTDEKNPYISAIEDLGINCDFELLPVVPFRIDVSKLPFAPEFKLLTDEEYFANCMYNPSCQINVNTSSIIWQDPRVGEKLACITHHNNSKISRYVVVVDVNPHQLNEKQFNKLAKKYDLGPVETIDEDDEEDEEDEEDED